MAEHKRIIFLDIDGVLNYHGSRTKNGFYVMDKECVAVLKKIVETYDAKIVISSAWRKEPNWKQHILNEFADAGWNNPPIIDKTPSFLFVMRGGEIWHWLKHNPTKSYIILDDDSDMLWTQKRFFVQTSMFSKGLTEVHLHRIREIWGDPQKNSPQ